MSSWWTWRGSNPGPHDCQSSSELVHRARSLRHESLRANIFETSLVPLINEQGEKGKGRDERQYDECFVPRGFGWRGTERRRAKRAAAQWSASQSEHRF